MLVGSDNNKDINLPFEDLNISIVPQHLILKSLIFEDKDSVKIFWQFILSMASLDIPFSS